MPLLSGKGTPLHGFLVKEHVPLRGVLDRRGCHTRKKILGDMPVASIARYKKEECGKVIKSS